MHIDLLAADPAPDVLTAARVLLGEYRAHARTAAGPGFNMAKMDREIAELPASQIGAGSGLLIAWLDGRPAGCVAFRPLPEVHPERASEMKRLWVRDAARGRGVAEALVRRVADEARGLGHDTVYLDTEPDRMPAAVRLYYRLGFVDCPLYRPSEDGLRAFRLALAAPGSAA